MAGFQGGQLSEEMAAGGGPNVGDKHDVSVMSQILNIWEYWDRYQL